MRKKMLTIVGARPQIIKAAAVSRVVTNEFSDSLEEVIIHTGQHYDHGMSQLFFDEMEIPAPSKNLHIGSADRASQLASMIAGLSEVIKETKPDVVLLYGDTNSTLAGALAASSAGVKIAHVEAGLRSFNKAMPEENNRILTDHLSTWLFAPTSQAIHNLAVEGIKNDAQFAPSPDHPAVAHCGDVMFDNAIYFKGKTPTHEVQNVIQAAPFMLATIHRDHNTDDISTLRRLIESLIQVGVETGHRIILPLHPRTKARLNFDTASALFKSPEIKLMDPLSYFDMLALLQHASLVLTDSGGLQKESFFFKRPCVILRPQTEWVELVENGNAIVCGSDKELIVQSAKKMIASENLSWPNFYGDGKASHFICEKILATV